MGQPYSDKPSGTASKSDMAGSDGNSSSKVDVVEVSGREAEASGSTFDTPLGRRMSPVDDLKHRLSLWGESNLQPEDSDEEGSEYELLLDPNLPEEYTRPAMGPPRTSGSQHSDEEKIPSIDKQGEEDSPYPEVRAAVRNYDVEAPCNTVGPIGPHNAACSC
jgi:hypothetical protein